MLEVYRHVLSSTYPYSNDPAKFVAKVSKARQVLTHAAAHLAIYWGMETQPPPFALADSLLVEAARRGDMNTFGVLFQRHSSRLRKRLERMLKNSEDARDAVQEAFLKAFVHLNAFEGKAEFSTWLMRIAINSALMELRKKRRRQLVPLETSEDGCVGWRADVIDHRVDIHRACEVAQMNSRVTAAVRRLRPALREVIELQLSLDCSQNDLAVLTNSSVPAVKSRVMRAKEALRTAVSERRSAN